MRNAIEFVNHLMFDIIGCSRKKNHTKRCNNADKNRFDFYRSIIIANIGICFHKTKHNCIQMRINCCRARHRKENNDWLKVPLKVILSYGTHPNELMCIDKVKYTGTRRSNQSDCTINNVICFLMNKSKHRHKRNKFEYDGSNRYVCILFQSLIQPLHTHDVKNDC